MVRLHSIAAMLAGFVFTASFTAHAALYEIVPSTLSVSGKLTTDITTFDRNGVAVGARHFETAFVQQGAGSLATFVRGTLDATVSNGQFSFDESRTLISPEISGDWIPRYPSTQLEQGPAQFGVLASVVSSVPPGASFIQQLYTSITDLTGLLRGAAPLSGSAGVQTFNPAWFKFISAGRVFSVLHTCVNGRCSDISSLDFSGGAGLVGGEGSLKVVRNEEILTLPISFSIGNSRTLGSAAEGAQVRSNWNGVISGTIVAVRQVPEPSSVALMCGGVVALAFARRVTCEKRSS